MAQKQFTTYQADILSFELREAMLGIAQPGRYQGYSVMASNGSPSGGLIPVRFSHGTPGFKKASHAVPPVLGSAVGIALTTQGTIIHEDQNIDKSIGVNGVASIRWDILYMEHVYLDSVGGNPATYGIQQGTAGSGKPSLSNPEKRVVIGYIKIAANGSTYSDLTYYPKASSELFGDTKILEKLFGTSSDSQLTLEAITNIASDGILGLRTYEEQNYVTNYQSLTSSINNLDKVLKDKADDILTLQLKRLDQWATPADNTDGNVSTAHHGLTPKLDNNSYHYLDGTGNWTKPSGQRLVVRPQTTNSDFDLKDILLANNVWYTIDLSLLVPSDVNIVSIRFYSASTSSSYSPVIYIKNNDDTGILRSHLAKYDFAHAYEYNIGIDSNKKLKVMGTNVNYLLYGYLLITGWQTAL